MLNGRSVAQENRVASWLVHKWNFCSLIKNSKWHSPLHLYCLLSDHCLITFRVRFYFRLQHTYKLNKTQIHLSGLSTQSISQSDQSNISNFLTFIDWVWSQGFRSQSQFGSCFETELGIWFSILTGSMPQLSWVSSTSIPDLDSIRRHYWIRYINKLDPALKLNLTFTIIHWIAKYSSFISTGGDYTPIHIDFTILIQLLFVVLKDSKNNIDVL